MPAMVRCSVCLHPQVRDVDLWLRDATGRSQTRSKIAAKFGLGPPALARHMRHGHHKTEAQWQALDVQRAQARAASVTPPAPAAGTDGIAQLEKLLGDLAAVDTSQYTPRDRNVHQDQLRRTAEALARLKPPADREGPAQEQVKALTGLMEVYDRVLDRHPEIQLELAEALHAWRSR